MLKNRTVPLPAAKKRWSYIQAAKYIGLTTNIRHCSNSSSNFLHLQLLFNAKFVIYPITTFKIYE